MEIRETKEIFAEYGLSDEQQEKIAREMARNPKKWVDFMMRFELGLDRPDPNRARQSAIVIGFSYVLGGLIPLSAYFFTSTTQEGLAWSSVITLMCLVVFGLVKSKLTGQPLFKGALRVTIVGVGGRCSLCYCNIDCVRNRLILFQESYRSDKIFEVFRFVIDSHHHGSFAAYDIKSGVKNICFV